MRTFALIALAVALIGASNFFATAATPPSKDNKSKVAAPQPPTDNKSKPAVNAKIMALRKDAITKLKANAAAGKAFKDEKAKTEQKLKNTKPTNESPWYTQTI
ncbi:hypothetical protein IWQ60_012576 [Tieghemiomyces parasiticus]|uniref:Uncharacterized protein n=1 Tax=Tieghemiomyces parasiticus TaxID=78921 RepID=A0A9W7ZF21_9FUNG|nr:hypothetical protein IWQ60_012576 [Tieghemiomyces parasiticus]